MDPTTPPPIPALERLTFVEFLATAVDHEDLRAVPGTHFHGQGGLYPEPVPGRTYAESNLCMSREADGTWCVDWAGNYWDAPLEVAEADLYGIYVSEMSHDDVRAYLLDVMPANEAVKPPPASLSHLTELYTGWMRLQGLDLGCALEALAGRVDLSDEQRNWLSAFCERWDAEQARERDRVMALDDAPESSSDAPHVAPGPEHPRYEAWRAAVADGSTVLGLAAWAVASPAP